MPIRCKAWWDIKLTDDERDYVFDPEDGERYLVTRYRPRGVHRTWESWDQHLIDLAPSRALLKEYKPKFKAGITAPVWAAFAPRYVQEMTAPTPAALIERLAYQHRSGDHYTLLCICSFEAFCHRTLLKELILAVPVRPPRSLVF
jgi:uncharacterized protein YeaO (DUF488 family)